MQRGFFNREDNNYRYQDNNELVLSRDPNQD